MPSPDAAQLQRDLVALTTAAHSGDRDALRIALEPYFDGLAAEAAPVAALLTMFARKLADAYGHIAEDQGISFEEFMQVAGQLSL